MIPGTYEIIVAYSSRNRAIGKECALPWIRKQDMQHFRRMTMGRVLVMGRTTWLGIGRHLPGRIVLVLTSKRLHDLPQDVHTVSSWSDPLIFTAAEKSGHPPIIAGGENVYRQALDMDLARVAHVTEVDVDVPDADAFMPPWPAHWVRSGVETVDGDCRFFTMVRGAR